MHLYWLDPDDDTQSFPPVELALTEPDGLLAVGGSLSPERLFDAYRHGIFPWYSEGQPILWWSPDPRSVLRPEQLKISRSLRKTLRRGDYEVTMDTAFKAVMESCAAPRPGQSGTWITEEMLEAYVQIHRLGLAHSVESWHEGELCGGLYGVAIGRAFFGESMFTRRSEASKVAFVHLVRQLEAWGYELIDCQMQTQHLDSLGAELMPRRTFVDRLSELCASPGGPSIWRLDPVLVERLRTEGT